MSTSESQLDNLYVELKNQYDQDDFNKCLELVENILSINNQDQDALYIRITLHLRLDNYEKALTCIGLLSAKTVKELNLIYEHLYILYSLDKFEDFEKVWKRDVNNNNELKNSLRFKVLNAQLAYKKEDYLNSIHLYEQVLNHVDKEDTSYNELYTNYLASIASYKFNTSKTEWKNIPSDQTLSNHSAYSTSYEANYNYACNLMANSPSDKQVKQWLDKAIDLSKDSLNESNYTQEEIDIELAPMLIQLAYHYHKLGQLSEAQAIYEQIINLNQSNTSFHPIALNNLNCLKLQEIGSNPLANSFQNIYGLEQQFKSIYSNSSQSKLQNYQIQSIKFNNALLALLMENYGRAQSFAQQLIDTSNESIDAKLLLCDVLNTKKGIQKAQSVLKEFIEKNPQDPTGYMALAQLSLTKLHYNSAIQYLEQFRSKVVSNKTSYFLPGIVGTLIWLYVSSNQVDKAEKLLSECQSSENPYKNEFSRYIPDQLAQIKLKTGNPQESVTMYQSLLQQDPNHLPSLAGLVNALSHVNLESAEQHASQLPSISDTRPRIPDSISQEWEQIQDSNNSLQSSRKRKNHRKNPVAKSQNTNGKIDPERWLPLKDRSYYKPKNKSKKVRGTQGASHSKVFDNNQEEEKVFGVQSKTQTTIEDDSKPKTTSNKSKSGGKKKSKGKKSKF